MFLLAPLAVASPSTIKGRTSFRELCRVRRWRMRAAHRPPPGESNLNPVVPETDSRNETLDQDLHPLRRPYPRPRRQRQIQSDHIVYKREGQPLCIVQTLTPAVGPVDGGYQITIRGAGFFEKSAVEVKPGEDLERAENTEEDGIRVRFSDMTTGDPKIVVPGKFVSSFVITCTAPGFQKFLGKKSSVICHVACPGQDYCLYGRVFGLVSSRGQKKSSSARLLGERAPTPFVFRAHPPTSGGIFITGDSFSEKFSAASSHKNYFWHHTPGARYCQHLFTKSPCRELACRGVPSPQCNCEHPGMCSLCHGTVHKGFTRTSPRTRRGFLKPSGEALAMGQHSTLHWALQREKLLTSKLQAQIENMRNELSWGRRREESDRSQKCSEEDCEQKIRCLEENHRKAISEIKATHKESEVQLNLRVESLKKKFRAWVEFVGVVERQLHARERQITGLLRELVVLKLGDTRYKSICKCDSRSETLLFDILEMIQAKGFPTQNVSQPSAQISQHSSMGFLRGRQVDWQQTRESAMSMDANDCIDWKYVDYLLLRNTWWQYKWNPQKSHPATWKSPPSKIERKFSFDVAKFERLYSGSPRVLAARKKAREDRRRREEERRRLHPPFQRDSDAADRRGISTIQKPHFYWHHTPGATHCSHLFHALAPCCGQLSQEGNGERAKDHPCCGGCKGKCNGCHGWMHAGSYAHLGHSQDYHSRDLNLFNHVSWFDAEGRPCVKAGVPIGTGGRFIT